MYPGFRSETYVTSESKFTLHENEVLRCSANYLQDSVKFERAMLYFSTSRVYFVEATEVDIAVNTI